MREVSVRILHFVLDLARTEGLDENALTEGLPSLALIEGQRPSWIDWDDIVVVMERLEDRVGGPEGLGRAFRAGLPNAYPEFRAFASIFLKPIPLFMFVMNRLLPTMYRNLVIEKIEHTERDRVWWRQSIPEPLRASVAFHRGSIPFAEVFPRHLDLPEARIIEQTITPRVAEFVVEFPAAQPLSERSARAMSAASSVLAGQLDEAFARIAATLRTEPNPGVTLGDANGMLSWADCLELSRRQRDVFALLVEGRANKDIAGALRCSERNVEFHVGRILRAARVTSRSELLVKVLGANQR